MKLLLITFCVLLFSQSAMASKETKTEDIETIKEEQAILESENKRLKKEKIDLMAKLHGGYADEIPVLMYHHLLKEDDIEEYGWKNNSAVLSLEKFESHMDYLHDNDFYVATIEELEKFIDGKLDLPEKTVVITFDDGYLSNAKYAYPILKKYNYKATIFMIGYRVDAPQEDFKLDSTQALSVDEKDKYKDVFKYESHTYEMHDFQDGMEIPFLITAEEKDIVRDLNRNKKLLDAEYFAYPYGMFNDKLIRILGETGHRLGFTISEGLVKKGQDKYRLPRNNMVQDVTMRKFKDVVNGINLQKEKEIMR